jgi:hypothetical protein
MPARGTAEVTEPGRPSRAWAASWGCLEGMELTICATRLMLLAGRFGGRMADPL